MTKTTLFPASVTRLIVVWVVIGLLTISIMKASAVQNSRLPISQPIPALSWHSTY